jgi:hypothetical protein
MRNLTAIFLLLPFLGVSQLLVPEDYANSTATPIKVEAGLTLKSAIDGYFINERRYKMYRGLQEYAASGKLKGKEAELIKGFESYLIETEKVASALYTSSERLIVSVDALKASQRAVDSLQIQIYYLDKTNRELSEKINRPVKAKKKWAVPALIGALVGVGLGVIVSK